MDFSLLGGISPIQFSSINNFEQLSTPCCARNYWGHKESRCYLASENFVLSQTQPFKYKFICTIGMPQKECRTCCQSPSGFAFTSPMANYMSLSCPLSELHLMQMNAPSLLNLSGIFHFPKLTGCSFSVSFAHSFSSSSPLNVRMSCTQSSDFYLSNLHSYPLSLFSGDLV